MTWSAAVLAGAALLGLAVARPHDAAAYFSALDSHGMLGAVSLVLMTASVLPNMAGHMTLNFTAFFSLVFKPAAGILAVPLMFVAILMTYRWVTRNRRARHRRPRGAVAEAPAA